MGVSRNYVPPDLHESPVTTKQPEVFQEDAVKRHNLGGMPPCAEASTKQCCLTDQKEANRVQIDCEVFNQEGLGTLFHSKKKQ